MDKCLQEIFDIIVTDTGMLLFLELVAVYHILRNYYLNDTHF